MEKMDFKKELKPLYQASAKEALQVQVPPLSYLMVDGQGDPNTAQSYKDALEALFPMAYTLKLMVKKGTQALDYGVMPLYGLCAQMPHIGPFSDEGPAIEKMHQFIAERGQLRGKHHEIYLSDIRRTVPEKWKTINRQPMQ
jgi:hypothetical protein